jgi:hypothetical protein
VSYLTTTAVRPIRELTTEELRPLPEKRIKRFRLPAWISADVSLRELPSYDGLPTRVKNCLRDEHFRTAGQLVEPSERMPWQRFFMTRDRFGSISLRQLVHFLLELECEPEFE